MNSRGHGEDGLLPKLALLRHRLDGPRRGHPEDSTNLALQRGAALLMADGFEVFYGSKDLLCSYTPFLAAEGQVVHGAFDSALRIAEGRLELTNRELTNLFFHLGLVDMDGHFLQGLLTSRVRARLPSIWPQPGLGNILGRTQNRCEHIRQWAAQHETHRVALLDEDITISIPANIFCFLPETCDGGSMREMLIIKLWLVAHALARHEIIRMSADPLGGGTHSSPVPPGIRWRSKSLTWHSRL